MSSYDCFVHGITVKPVDGFCQKNCSIDECTMTSDGTKDGKEENVGQMTSVR